jgi:hypothetical protein
MYIRNWNRNRQVIHFGQGSALNSVFGNLFIYSVRPYVPIWISPSSSYAECKHPFSFKTDIYIIVHRNMESGI